MTDCTQRPNNPLRVVTDGKSDIRGVEGRVANHLELVCADLRDTVPRRERARSPTVPGCNTCNLRVRKERRRVDYFPRSYYRCVQQPNQHSTYHLGRQAWNADFLIPRCHPRVSILRTVAEPTIGHDATNQTGLCPQQPRDG